jgi:hypothetical protein
MAPVSPLPLALSLGIALTLAAGPAAAQATRAHGTPLPAFEIKGGGDIIVRPLPPLPPGSRVVGTAAPPAPVPDPAPPPIEDLALPFGADPAAPPPGQPDPRRPFFTRAAATVPVAAPESRRTCRDYEGKVEVGGVAVPAYARLCRSGDGAWHVVE